VRRRIARYVNTKPNGLYHDSFAVPVVNSVLRLLLPAAVDVPVVAAAIAVPVIPDGFINRAEAEIPPNVALNMCKLLSGH
jgi:hypothetical protein